MNIHDIVNFILIQETESGQLKICYSQNYLKSFLGLLETDFPKSHSPSRSPYEYEDPF